MNAQAKGAHRILWISIILAGLIWRLYAAIHFQSRTWIDEVWVVLEPGFNLFAGAGRSHPHWEWSTAEIRSWIVPSLFAGYLKILSFFGITSGAAVISVVRATAACAGAGALTLFSILLGRAMRLKYAPVLAAAVLLLNPEFVHYSTTVELSVLALPVFLFGLYLSFGGEEEPLIWRRRMGFLFLAGSALIRFQFGALDAAILIFLVSRRQFRESAELVSAGVFALLFEIVFDSLSYGHFIFPIYRYFHVNAVAGHAAEFGITPFYFGFEILWRFISEPLFLVAVLTAPFAIRRSPRSLLIAGTAYSFFLIHCLIGHKEYRFFYPAAVLVSGVAGAALQAWCEQAWIGQNRRKTVIAVLTAFLVFWNGISIFRGVRKVGWSDFQVTARLETLAGTQSDLKGLITFGWGGIYYGGTYNVHRYVPYLFAESRAEIGSVWKERFAAHSAADFNYVIAPDSEPAPCANLRAKQGGGSLYQCRPDEIATLLR